MATPRKKLYKAALREADLAGVVIAEGTDPGEALQWLIDRNMVRLRHASAQVDLLDPDELTVDTAFGPADHHWVRAEDKLAGQLAHLVEASIRAGLAERMVRLEEAKAQLMVRALTAAAAEAGIERSKVRAIGPAFRRQLQVLQGEAA